MGLAPLPVPKESPVEGEMASLFTTQMIIALGLRLVLRWDSLLRERATRVPICPRAWRK